MNTQNSTAGPYTPIREANGVYYISGCIGSDAATKTAEPDIAAQVHKAFDNLATILATKDLSFSNLVKTTVFLIDMADYAVLNKVYIERIPSPRPARTCVAVAELPRVANVPLRVEIEAIAVK